MPFTAFVVYENAAPNLIRGFGRSQAQANARANEDAGWTAHAGQIADIPTDARGDGNWRFDVGTTSVQRYDPVTVEQQVELWKGLISEKAVLFDNSIRMHWTVGAKKVSDHPFRQAVTDLDSVRLDDTLNWGRSFIGMPWLEALKYGGDADALALVMGNNSTDALSEDAIQAQIEQMQAELVSKEHIFFWYEGHTPAESWRGYYAQRDIWTTQGGGNIGRPFPADARHAGIPQATWDAIMLTYYQDALRYAVGIPAGGTV